MTDGDNNLEQEAGHEITMFLESLAKLTRNY